MDKERIKELVKQLNDAFKKKQMSKVCDILDMFERQNLLKCGYRLYGRKLELAVIIDNECYTTTHELIEGAQVVTLMEIIKIITKKLNQINENKIK